MRPRLLSGLLLRIAPAALLFSVLASAQTTFTGTVYSPLGVPNGTGTANTGGDPIPNILVFAVDPNYPPPTFSQGQVLPTGNQTGCEAQPSLVPTSVLGSSTTDYKGNFSFVTSGAIPNPVTIVIQAGKWRRQYQFDSTTVKAGATNALPPLSMPSAQGSGIDLPHIAISTGYVDALECIIHQIGISDSEVTGPTGPGSINLYQGSKANSGGEVNPAGYPTSSETTLVSDQTELAKYDVVMFGCQGSPTGSGVNTADIANLTTFANNGGRIFASHYEYFLLQQAPFSSVASFQSGSAEPGLQTATINTTSSFPGGTTLSNWINYIGLDYNNTPSEIQFDETGPNVLSTNADTTEVWATLNSNSRPMQFTFDTPLGTAGTPTVTIGYTNTTTTFEQGDASDSITVNITNTSTVAVDSSLTLALTLPSGFTASTLSGGFGTGWACNVAALTCSRTASNMPLAAGASDPVTITFGIASTATVGQQSVLATLNGGGLSGTNQCGRVLYTDYHIEEVSNANDVVYPRECSNISNSTLAQQKFLEYSLYNLSNFVAPSTTDLIDVQGPTVLAWATPTPTYYGVGFSGTQLDATATDKESGATVPGTFAYTIGTTPLVAGTVLDAGTYNVTATFTPTDPTSYTSGTPVQVTLTVLPDPTTTALTANPANTPAGQTVTLTAMTTDIYASTAGQTVTFYDGTAVLGISTVGTTGSAIYTINTFSLGSHALKACLNQTKDYVSSCSTLTTEIITFPTTATPTTTLVASNLNPSVVGQTVTFTATVASTGSFNVVPTGTVTFYDGTTTLGSGILSAGVATFATSTLTAGTHNITASYGATATTNASTSVILAQVVTTSLASAGEGFIMTVTPTTFSVGAGSSINLGVTVLEFNNFNTPVNLACSGLPAEATCTFGTTTIPAGGGSTPVAVFVSAPHVCNTNQQYFAASFSRGLPIVALMTFLFFARRRRALKGLVLALLLCVIPSVTGCGNCTDLGVSPGTYTFTITGTAQGTATPVVVKASGTSSSTPSESTQAQSMTMTVTI